MNSKRAVVPAVLAATVAVVAAVALAAVPPATAPGSDPGAGRSATPASAGAPADVRRVVVISVDGLNPDAITRTGRAGTPALHRMIREGASTLEARTAVERTVTLPNHTGMLTGRRVSTRAGHGIDVNRDPGGTVSSHAGRPVASVFSTLAARGLRGNLYTGKSEFDLFRRSWSGGIARYVEIAGSTRRLTEQVRRDLRQRPRPFAFLHLAGPDEAGHEHGWMSREYLAEVRRVDAAIGRLVSMIRSRPRLARSTTVLLTSDHGGSGNGHSDAGRRVNYRVPFLAWGAGVARGADLYRINPRYRHPGRGRPGYAGPQPVRNAAIGNLALDLLGLGPVPGSRVNARQDLGVR